MWYRTGTVTLTNGSATVTGTGTNWIDQHAGWVMVTEASAALMEVKRIISSTEIELAQPVADASASGLTYFIIPTHSLNADLVDSIDAMITEFSTSRAAWQAVYSDFTTTTYQLWLDQGNSGTVADFLAAITGPQGAQGDQGDSAYQVWLAEGNTGTEADFLDALSAGAITAAQAAQAASETAQGLAEAAQTGAETAETGAQAGEAKAQEWAETAEDTEVELGKYSALHHSAKAQAAETGAVAAQGAAEAARDTAQGHATQTASDLASVAAIFDSFDDRYLGAKAADPTVDNDGNALVIGAVYWNTTDNEARFWNGTVWEAPSAAAATSAQQAIDAKLAALAAQAAAETAQGLAETAQAASEAAQTGAQAAQGLSEDARDASQVAQGLSEGARDAAQVAQAASETAQGLAEGAQAGAQAAEAKALDWAETAEDVEVELGKYSALHHSAKAQTAETGALAAQVASETAQGAAAAAQAAAAGSASDASASATSAADAETGAVSALDSFTDIYLGPKATDPTVDNDGDPLAAGMLYSNTTSDVMKVYLGGSWRAAYADLSGALIATANLSDLTDAAAARSNLGLGTAATAATGDFATAAQGATADSAVQPGDLATVATSGAYGDLSGRPSLGTAAPLNVPTSGDAAAGEVVRGSDSRLTDARAPTSHTHSKSEISDFSDGDYATTAQGALADSAVQPADLTEGLRARFLL